MPEITAEQLAERWSQERPEEHDWRGVLARGFVEQRQELARLRAAAEPPPLVRSKQATELSQAIELVFQTSRVVRGLSLELRQAFDAVDRAARAHLKTLMADADKPAAPVEAMQVVRAALAGVATDEMLEIESYVRAVSGG
jgi:hypothetical protein